MTKRKMSKLATAGLAIAGALGGASPAHAIFGIPDVGDIQEALDKAREAQAEKDIQTMRQLGVPRDSSLANEGYNVVDRPVVTQHLTMGSSSDSLNNVTIFRREHEDSFGNGRFGGGYQLKTHATATRTSVTADSQLRGYTNTWVRALGKSFGVFTVDAVANTINNSNSQWAGIWYNVMVFGKTVSSKTLGGGAYNVEKKVINKTQRVGEEVSATFTVFGVPVKVGAQVRANEYLNLKGRVWIDEINATVTPGGSLWVNAYAMVGIDGVVNGSVRGNLKVVEVAVPATVKAAWQFGPKYDDGRCAANILTASTVDWVARQLDGNIAVCGEVLGWEKCRQIADWRGFSQRSNLFNYSRNKALDLGPCLSIPAAPIQS